MRLSTKLLLFVGVISAVGFGALVLLETVTRSEELLDAHKKRSETLATSVSTGIQNIMLTGEAVHAEQLVQDTRKLAGVHRLVIYDQYGVEVFMPREKRFGGTDDGARRALADGTETRTDAALIRPLANAEPCHRCHEADEKWRGAIAVSLKPCAPGELVDEFAEAALRNVMISGEADEVDGYLARLEELPAVRRALVLDGEGDPRFGKVGTPLPQALTEPIQTLLRVGGAVHIDAFHLFAIANEPACHVCHGSDHEFRGVVAIELDTIEPAQLIDTAAALFQKSLIQLMVSDRGNQLDAYLTELRESPFIQVASLFDGSGREVYPPAEPRSLRGARTDDRRVHGVLESGDAGGFDEEETTTHLVPLPNEVRCQACHGSDHEIRGVVRVETDVRPVRAAVRRSVRRSALIGVCFVLVSSLVLFVFIRFVFVRPVVMISGVAQAVGRGELDGEVEHTSSDEVGELARSMNDMIMGLRSKLMMERFVGDHTRRMIDESVRGAREHRVPVRRKIAVLFSDVRGFTSYSEQYEPERVIQTLNVYLGLQAEVVERFGGYVDKFVGDEVMALFEGDDMELRAVRAGQAMIEAVATAPVTDRMTIGVGINAGEVVFGSTGSKERQDYTVIGDVVNLGARLCSVAGPGVLIVSRPVRDAIDDPEIVFSAVQEMHLKGKAQPVEVFSIRPDPE